MDRMMDLRRWVQAAVGLARETEAQLLKDDGADDDDDDVDAGALAAHLATQRTLKRGAYVREAATRRLESSHRTLSGWASGRDSSNVVGERIRGMSGDGDARSLVGEEMAADCRLPSQTHQPPSPHQRLQIQADAPTLSCGAGACYAALATSGRRAALAQAAVDPQGSDATSAHAYGPACSSAYNSDPSPSPCRDLYPYSPSCSHHAHPTNAD